jgi:hypothetical protein
MRCHDRSWWWRELGRAFGPAWMVALVLLSLGLARPAAAQLHTCVEVQAGKRDAAALAKLVRAEVDRHPTHRAAEGDDCQGHLTVEVVDLGAADGAWVTGRINGQVPHRERIGPDGLTPAIERLLTVVLHNDPLVLRGPESNSWLRRQATAMERRSTFHAGVEIYELAAPLGSSVATLPGVALALRREVSALFVGVRVGGALSPGARSDRLRLHAQVDAQIEAALYASPAADVSLFGGVLIGLSYQRFDGPAPLDGPGATGIATSTGVSLALRGGFEALRTSNVHVVAFLQLQAPAFVSSDADHGVVDRWVPGLVLGAGVVF